MRGSVVECANAKHCAAVSFNSSGRSPCGAAFWHSDSRQVRLRLASPDVRSNAKGVCGRFRFRHHSQSASKW